MKNMDDFRFEGKPSHARAKLTPFKDEWDTKEDTGKSIKNALYVLPQCGIPKGTCRAEAMSNSENN